MQMKRERATAVLNEMLKRLEQNAWPLNLITEIHLFGSYIRGALEVGDIDVVVQHTTDDCWTEQSLDAFFGGRDSYVPMRRALRGNRRGISFQFQGRDSLQSEDIELLLLWRQGEPIALARRRLAAITPDTTAGRAPRDHVLPAYETLADLIPRPVRIDLHRWSTDRKITVTTHALRDAQPRFTTATRHMDYRWVPNSPLRRAAAAALAYLESTGQRLDRCEVHRQYLVRGVTDQTIDCFVDLGWRYWRSAERYLADGQSWFEVLPATSRQPLNALHITPAARP
ncbi:hypothetical protein [Streptomyces nigrescens]|uniref:Polymerase nucleotidyl transferase domain-containing protein n=1 Tax=Streptomyces nigrescens TaxID=1920 RepID=A0A640TXE0_STRNI|nr:hypothetical protein [Streptomyces libani]WAT94409.1 hypothetical protein STRLI_000006 [Streptomyces libani subsp. libani]WAU01562.1 hypothetical protein STRLI_007938 [Streptomyces libani subsp. libani]GFE27532.1 hypothetical protein Sliba_79850 [Streptomyces libani subsp. libani]GGW08448.1 hypothetical protein GCM10010500_79340 [Streptomyces libani subsp. libani]